MSDSSRLQRLYLARLPCPWDFTGKSTGVGSYMPNDSLICLVIIIIKILCNFMKCLLCSKPSAKRSFDLISTQILWHAASVTAATSLQSCPTQCDPIGGSPPGSPVPGILQARTLEWVAISFSNAWEWKEKVKSLSRVWLLVTPWTAAQQVPPSMGFSRQEYWSVLPLPSPKSYEIGTMIFPY